MRILLLALLTVSFAHATQTPLNKRGDPLVGGAPLTLETVDCEVRAKLQSEFFDTEAISFQGRTREEKRIGWKMSFFEQLSSTRLDCPKADFEIIVRGTIHYRDPAGRDIYSYRDELPQPTSEVKVYRLRQLTLNYGQGGKTFTEWRIVR